MNGDIPDTLLEGLALDVSVLDALLKRHRCSHGRTIYFRRMEMVLNRLFVRSRKSMVENAVFRLKIVRKDLNQYHQEQNRKIMSRKRRYNDEEEQWDINKEPDASLSRSSRIARELKDLSYIWTRNFPELLLRIQHASKALFTEVTRGFFLPFCTVGLGALARIRSLLMFIGLGGLIQLQELEFEASEILGNSNSKDTVGGDYTQYMNLFVEDDSKNGAIKISMRQSSSSSNQDLIVDQNSMLRSLGLTKPNRRTRSKADASGAQSTTSDLEFDGAATFDNTNYNDQEQSRSTVIELRSNDIGYHSLATVAPDDDPRHIDGILDDNSVDRDCKVARKTGRKDMDTLDRNMAFVDRFQQEKKNKKQKSNSDKRKKKHSDNNFETDVLPRKESERKKNGKSDATSKMKKKKKLKKDKGGDFFDQLFD